jgi:arsenate reductase (glutaredoxin)
MFGRRDSRDTQKALRFFRERRVAVSFVDLASKQLAPTELRRFTSRLTARALLDEGSRTFRDSGLGYMRLDEDELFERLMKDQSLLRLPLARAGQNVSVGFDEKAWRAWLAPAG